MNRHFSFLIISVDEDGIFNFSLLEIGWGHRVGALFGLQYCPDCGVSMDFFWAGLYLANE
ncbi:MAG TPA: hypothetical protein VGO57_02220 [Verrucomicrobiae bacterium]|jgi:hypothetical protein